MPADRHEDGLEPPRVTLGPVLGAAAGTVALLFATIGALAWVYSTSAPPPEPPPHAFPAPRLRTDEVAERHRLEAEQRARLAGYRWIDKDAKVVAIPIERAMEFVAGRGLDAFSPIGDVHVGEARP